MIDYGVGIGSKVGSWKRKKHEFVGSVIRAKYHSSLVWNFQMISLHHACQTITAAKPVIRFDTACLFGMEVK
jgi:hypothetical protein